MSGIRPPPPRVGSLPSRWPGVRLIQDPQGEYARRLLTVASTRPPTVFRGYSTRRSVKMNKELELLDLLDREEKVFSCFQTAIGLIDPNLERDPAKVEELLDFLSEEYNRVRDQVRNLIVANRPSVLHARTS